jgi:nucleotide-binding universal stress UspA family protein
MESTKMKKVLIALDYDPTAQKVAETGFSLAKSMGAEVVLMHVISDPVYYASTDYSPIMGFTGYTDLGPLQLDSVDGLKNATKDFLESFKHNLADKNIQTLVKEGDVADAILKAAHEVHAEIIVMGSHSRKWLENIVMGSVTEKVLHQTTVPLYVIPTKKHNQ